MPMQYSQHVHGCHHNLFPCGPPRFYKAPLTIVRPVLNSYLYTSWEKKGLENMQYCLREQNGHLKLQSTRPQTLGFALDDSPEGLLGWLVEKLHKSMGYAHYTMPDEEILTFVMLHWMQGATPGMRFYKAAYAEQGPYNAKSMFTTYLRTPLGVSSFLREILCPLQDGLDRWGI